jgi:hypothetical protein
MGEDATVEVEREAWEIPARFPVEHVIRMVAKWSNGSWCEI